MSLSYFDFDSDTQLLLEAAEALPPLPVSAIRLAALASDPNAEISDVVETVSYDQLLTSVVLRQANSAASAARRSVGTIRDAIMRLGVNPIVTIALSEHVSAQMVTPLPEYGLAPGELWRQSVLSSIAAEQIRTAASVPVPAEAVTAALLHDIGKLVLARFRDQRILELIAMAKEDVETDFDAERAVLEVHHGEVGALVAQNWHLPESIVNAIQYHHTPSEHPEPICFAVALADIVASQMVETREPAVISDDEPRTDDSFLGQVGRSRDRLAEAQAALGIDADALHGVVRRTATRFDSVRRRYNIEG